MMKDASLVVDARTAQEIRAMDPQDAGGLPLITLEHWVSDIRNQPPWRTLSDRCADYYDGNQVTQEQRDENDNAGMATIQANIIRPVVDVVLGMEAKTRQDWRVSADSAEFADVAEVQSAKLFEAEREARADRACSDAYAGQIKAGLHWVEVGRSMDPFEYPYRVRAIHRREIWWDWRSKEPDLSDARYLLRRRWVDRDELIAFFPEQAQLINTIGMGLIPFSRIDTLNDAYTETLVNAHQREMRTSLDELDWRDLERDRLCLGELWYRTWHRGMVIKVGNRVIPVDTKNPYIAAAIALRKVKIQPAVYSKLRLSWWIGPHRLADVETKQRRFPYVPFWGFREDLTGAPYGLIKSMLDPQDEYNARRSKLMWLLSAKRVKVDDDALNTDYNDFKALQREASRPDAMIVMNSKRRTGSDVVFETDFGLATQQFEVMHDAQALLQQTAGVYQAMMGQQSNASSGLAINSLVEQGAITLAEVNDNFRFGRRMVGQLLMDLIVEDIGGDEFTMSVGDDSAARVITLNQRLKDGSIVNDLMRARTRVALEDVPSTPAYRMQIMQMLSQLTNGMPDNVKAILSPMFIEATDLPQRREAAAQIRKALGIVDPKAMTPDQRDQAEKMLEEQQRKQQEAQDAQLRALNATAAEKEARARKAQAEADKIVIEATQARQALIDSESGPGQNEQALMDQLQQVVAQALQERQALQQELDEARSEFERDLAEVRDALASAQFAAETSAAETKRAQVEAKARQRDAATSQRFEKKFEAMRNEIAAVKQKMSARPKAEATA